MKDEEASSVVEHWSHTGGCKVGAGVMYRMIRMNNLIHEAAIRQVLSDLISSTEY